MLDERMRPWHLSPRLAMLLAFIQPCLTLADIGSDHGYVICGAVQEGLAQRGIAVELNEAPWLQTRRTVMSLGMSEQIDVRLGDGLLPLGSGEADAVCISGMGGKTIASILSRGKDRLSSVAQLILQPNTDAHILRAELRRLNFATVGESLVLDDGVTYQVLRCVPCTDVQREELGPLELVYGRIILAGGGPLLSDLMKRDIAHLRKITSHLAKSDSSEAAARREHFETEIGLRESFLANMTHR